MKKRLTSRRCYKKCGEDMGIMERGPTGSIRVKCCTHGCKDGWPYKQRPSHELRHPDLRDHQALSLLPITPSHSSPSSASHTMAAAGRIGLSKLADSSRMCTHRRPWQLEAVAGLENGHTELCNPPSHVGRIVQYDKPSRLPMPAQRKEIKISHGLT